MKITRLQFSLSFVWVIIISLTVGSIHSWHLVEFTPKLSSVNFDNLTPKTDNYGTIHFLTPMCSCSETVLKHLIKRGPLPENESQEMVVLIDDNENIYTKKLKKVGFKVLTTDFEQAKKRFSESISGVPLLVIYDQANKARYVGGYSAQLITPFTKIDISSFLKKISQSNGRQLASLPVKGCSVSKEYQKILDPLGLKYSSK